MSEANDTGPWAPISWKCFADFLVCAAVGMVVVTYLAWRVC